MLAVIASLIKIRITLSVGLIASVGWYIAHSGFGEPSSFVVMLAPTILVCSGVCALNHVLEWRSDSLMKRTQDRPIPTGAIGFHPALIIGLALTAVGLWLIWQYIGLGMFVGAFITAFIYLLVYTPLKKITWFNTTVGAIPGALPIMGGWFAAKGELGWEGWVLFAVMFFWQHPHFYAIAWVCKNDYKRAGYRMLVENDLTGNITFCYTLVFTVLLAVSTWGLHFTEFSAGWIYLISVMIINIIFLWEVLNAYRCSIEKKSQAAQKIVRFSVWYQVLYFVFIIVDNLFRVKIL